MADKSRSNKKGMRELIEQVQKDRRTLLKLSPFPDEARRTIVLDVYQE
ncbi:hypothetical protein [Polystyrenella longa]|nr:hypothetical protein [Polystyrenella longa]